MAMMGFGNGLPDPTQGQGGAPGGQLSPIAAPGGTYLSGQSQSGSYSPDQASHAFDLVNSTADSGVGALQQMLGNPLGSSFQAIVGPILQAMQPYLQAQQGQLTDAVRATGGLRDSSYSNALESLLGTQATQMGGAVMQQAVPFINAMQGLAQAPSNVAQGAARSFPTYNSSWQQQFTQPHQTGSSSSTSTGSSGSGGAGAGAGGMGGLGGLLGQGGGSPYETAYSGGIGYMNNGQQVTNPEWYQYQNQLAGQNNTLQNWNPAGFDFSGQGAQGGGNPYEYVMPSADPATNWW